MSAQTVFIVDDEEAIGKVLARELRRLRPEWTARSFVSPREALAVLAGEGGDADMLLSDRNMPDMDGLAFLRAARELRPSLAEVLMTGSSDGSAADGPPPEGVCAVLGKPWDLDGLSAVLDKAEKDSAARKG